MQFQASQRGNVERVFANYYLMNNVWNSGVAHSYNAGLRGPNLRGCWVSFVRSSASQATVPVYGTAVTLGSNLAGTGDDSCQDIVAGCLESKMVVGTDALVNTWVTLCVYGWMDQIACDGNISANDDFMVMQETSQVVAFGATNRGLGIGYSRPAARAPRALEGILLLTLKTPADTETIFINLDGTANTSGTGGDSTWLTPPGKSNLAILDTSGVHDVPKGDAPVIAALTSRAQRTPLEVVSGGTGIPAYVEGWVFTLGFSKAI